MTARAQIAVALLLVVLTFGLYWRAISFDFVRLDDHLIILNNPSVHEWSGIKNAFAHDVWENEEKSNARYYRPIYMTWFVVGWKSFGPHAAGWHIASIGMCAILTLLIWRIALLLWGSERVALLTALIWLLHPTRVEDAVWISASTDLLMGIFVFLAVYLYLRWERDLGGNWLLFASGVASLLAMLSKEAGIATPLLIAACAFWMRPETSPDSQILGTRLRSAVLAAGPGLISLMLYLPMRILATSGSLTHNSYSDVLRTIPLICCYYLKLIFWPYPLAAAHPVVLQTHFSVQEVLLPVLLLALVAVAVWRTRRRDVQFLCAWFWLALLPSIAGATVFPSDDLVHDRYLLVSSFAFSLGLAWGILKLMDRLASWPELVRRAIPAAVCLLLAALTWNQQKWWGDDFSLYEHIAETAPTNIKYRCMYANQLFKSGQVEAALKTYDDTLRFAPDRWEVNFAYGVTLMDLGYRQPAEQLLRRTAELNPGEANAYLALASLLNSEGRKGEAITVLKSGASQSRAPETILRALQQMKSQN